MPIPESTEWDAHLRGGLFVKWEILAIVGISHHSAGAFQENSSQGKEVLNFVR